jgi:hypothetical protein
MYPLILKTQENLSTEVSTPTQIQVCNTNANSTLRHEYQRRNLHIRGAVLQTHREGSGQVVARDMKVNQPR